MDNTNNVNNAGGADNRDYLDKGLEAVEKKFGGARFAGPDAAAKNRSMNEKITDTIRKLIEKVTGYVFYTLEDRGIHCANVLSSYRKKVPSKVSN